MEWDGVVSVRMVKRGDNTAQRENKVWVIKCRRIYLTRKNSAV
jgi:hypothetical protein